MILLVMLSCHCFAQIYADFTTSAGNFTCELNYKHTPKTVANFISLAEGTRTWLDEKTENISTIHPPQPFYNGLSFHRIVNDDGFKIIQTGSRKGDGTDGAGYTFPDEINLAQPSSFLFDKPYVIAMANFGPNSNSSQLFITGCAMPKLMGKHTVFGDIVAGKNIIDLILTSGDNSSQNPVIIHKINIRRASEESLRFQTSAQHLPVLSSAITEKKEIRYDDQAFAPKTLSGLTLQVINGDGFYKFTFHADGKNFYQFAEKRGEPILNNSFILEDFSQDGYGATLILSPEGQPVLRLRLGFDEKTNDGLVGRILSTKWNGSKWSSIGGDAGFTLISEN
jgi:peptidyl-prolyl cis-trans isomerase A (cyclophilin A)